MYLAQINIAQLIAPEGDPRVADFFAQVPSVNALADASNGFVWRFEGDYPDSMIAFNMSVWESIESLRQFVYRSDHVHVLKRKHEWFSPMKQHHMALWWVDKGHLPSIDEGLAKLALLNEQGPSSDAFTFANIFSSS